MVITFYSYSQDTITYNAYFDSDEHLLKPDQIKSLDELLKKLEGDLSDFTFEIQGHTDSIGNWEYNLQLSDKRCLSLEEEVLKLGVSRSQIKIKANSYGSPIDKNSTIKGRAHNRRAQINIIFTPEKPDWTLTEQSFKVNPNVENVITTSNGCVITIPANATLGTEKAESVDYRITEYNNPAEFIAAGIPMSYKQQSGFYLYHSEELFNIHALHGKDTLKLSKNNTIKINCKTVDTSQAVKFYKFNSKQKNWVENKVVAKKVDKKAEERESKVVEQKKESKQQEKKQETKEVVELKVVDKKFDPKKKLEKIKIDEYTIDTAKKWLNIKPVEIDTVHSIAPDVFDDFYLLNMRSCSEYWWVITKHALIYTLQDFNPYTDTTAEYVEKNRSNLFQYSEYYKNFIYARTRFVDTNDAGTKNNTSIYSLKLNHKKLLFRKKYIINFKQLKRENSFFTDFVNYEWVFEPKKNNVDINLLAKKKFSDYRISYDQQTNITELELKGRSDFYSLTLVPKIKKPEQEMLSNKVKHFTDSLSIAEKLFYENLRKRKTIDSMQFKNGLRIAFNKNYFSLYDFWYYSECAKEKNEKDLSYHEWIRYFNKNRSQIRAKYLNYKEHPNLLYSSCCKIPPKEIVSGDGDPEFLILNFGLYNFDKVVPLNSLITLKDYNFVSEKGNPIEVDYAFLILKGINGMVNFGDSKEPFLVKGFNNTLVIFSKNKRCYKFECNLDKKDFFEQKTITFKNITKKIRTKKGFEKEMNVN